MNLSPAMILAERLRRQRLLEPAATVEDYLALFALLQPIAPFFFSYPGSPPTLVHRTAFDEGTLTERLREHRELVKGRFLGGTVGYVLAADLGPYAQAFRRPLAAMSWTQRRVFDALQHAGPLSPRQLGEETDLLNKEAMPALHRLQEAFLVYEDQLTADLERGWYVFASEWPEVMLTEDGWEAAAVQVLRRFFRGHVFATPAQVKDWTGWTNATVKRALALLEDTGAIAPCGVPGLGDGWLESGALSPTPAPPTVFMLHKADPLVRAQASELKRRFAGLEVLQYLLIDGAFQGAVAGHWRIGPHDVDDIVLELPHEERAARREEILRAVSWGYRPPFSHIRKYDGQVVG